MRCRFILLNNHITLTCRHEVTMLSHEASFPHGKVGELACTPPRSSTSTVPSALRHLLCALYDLEPLCRSMLGNQIWHNTLFFKAFRVTVINEILFAQLPSIRRHYHKYCYQKGRVYTITCPRKYTYSLQF